MYTATAATTNVMLDPAHYLDDPRGAKDLTVSK